MEEVFKITKKELGETLVSPGQLLSYSVAVLLLCLSAQSWALTCLHWQDRLRDSELLFSFIPMRGEVVLGGEQAVMVFTVDVHQVWRGELAEQETIVVEWPGAFPLAEEFILAVNRNTDGLIQTGSCTFVLPVHGYRDLEERRTWFHDTFGEPPMRYLPGLLDGAQ